MVACSVVAFFFGIDFKWVAVGQYFVLMVTEKKLNDRLLQTYMKGIELLPVLIFKRYGLKEL